MRNKFYQFMEGRNGADQLGRFVSYIALGLIVLNLFLRLHVLWLLGLLALAYSYFRMFSRNVYRRREENGKFLQWQYRCTTAVKNWLDRQKQRKDFAFFRCPGCHVMLRVPRGKGKILVTCRKCGNAFERRT